MGLQGTSVLIRSGNLSQKHDLEKVSAPHARSVTILSDMSMTANQADAKSLRIMLCLQQCLDHLSGHITVEMQDVDNRRLMVLLGNQNVEVVVAHDFLGRVIVRSSNQSGLSQVLTSLLGFKDNDLYIKNWPDLYGKQFGEIVYLFEDAIVLGIQEATGDCNLNPAGDEIYDDGDSLVFLAWDDDTYHPMPPKEAYPVQLANTHVDKKTSEQETNETILVVGWRRDLCDFLQEIHVSRPRCTRITIFAGVPIDERENRLSENGRWRNYDAGLKQKLEHVVGEATSRRDLLSLKLERYDSIFVVADEFFDGKMEERDGSALNTTLLILDIKQSNPEFAERIAQEGNTNLIVEILGTDWLTGFSQVTDYVMSNNLVSSALAMVTECRAINNVLSVILDRGCDISLHSILEYVPRAQLEAKMAFWDIVGYVRRQDSICLGYLLNEEGWQPKLNPENKRVLRRWSETTKLVILCDAKN